MTAKKDDVKLLSVEEMLAADDVRYEVIDAFGGKVRIGSISAGEMMEFMTQNQGPGKKTAGLRLFIASLVDATGKRIGNNTMISMFAQKNAADINRVVARILKLNGLDHSGFIDIEPALKNAGTDETKLKALIEELRMLANQIEDAGTDVQKLAQITDQVAVRAGEARKNA